MSGETELEDGPYWLDPPQNDVERMMLVLAKAYDEYHADYPGKVGAETAIRAANGIACPYWEHMAEAALAAKGEPPAPDLAKDAVERAAEVIADLISAEGDCWPSDRVAGSIIAQALSDAGLLAKPMAPVLTREEAHDLIPTAAMLEAGAAAGPDTNCGAFSTGDAYDVWSAMMAKAPDRPSVSEYVASYEFRGECDYTPTDNEKALIEDAIEGYLALPTPPDASRTGEAG